MMTKTRFIYEPRGVVCTRGSIRTGLTFDAELIIGEHNYVLATGLKDREKAKDIADNIAGMCASKLRDIISDYVKTMQIAKE